MTRQVVFVALQDAMSDDERTQAIEAACNSAGLADYRLVDVSLFSNLDESAGSGQPKALTFGYYLFFERG